MFKVGIGALVVGIIILTLWFLLFRGYEITNVPPKNNTIVAFGDSLVSGIGSTHGGFVSLLEQETKQTIINLGVPGNTSHDGLARLDEVRKLDPGIVIILFGGNDAIMKVPMSDTFSNLEEIIRPLQKDGAVTVLLGVRGGIISDPYDDAFAALARTTGSVYVPNVLSGIFGRGEYMADTIHPNDKGYSIIAKRVLDELKPLIGTVDNVK